MLDTWAALDRLDFQRVLYDDRSARSFVADRLSARHARALTAGGAYIDADDVSAGADPAALFVDGKLRPQPMCYDSADGEMVGPDMYLGKAQPSPQWIFSAV